jgi:hypothetical protein
MPKYLPDAKWSAKVGGNPFSERLLLDLPIGTNMVLISVNDGKGNKPVLWLLPHQIYPRTIERLLIENPGTLLFVFTPVTAEQNIYLEVW